ncbi:Alpha/Beta hydrolase protein [Mycena olivaceomarginata]|nr:Alpha/Beta hydrolase protein [Mycena olivaceomarginata]
MHTHNHSLIGAAAAIPVNDAKPIISFSPVVLSTPERAVNLELRVTMPTTGDALPIVLLAHGQGMSNWLSSMEGYAPLAEFWAAHGFAVLQPTHLSSKILGLKPPPGQELFWQERSIDMVRILDNIDAIEDAVPGLKGRLDRSRIAVAGHSAGSWTVASLLGASNTDPRDGTTWYQPDPRVKAGVFLAGVGNGGAGLSEMGRTVLVPFFGPDFSKMERPVLVVCGDEDVGPHLTVRGADWHADAYTLAPGSKDLVWLKGGKHGLGGIAGWDAAETKDESPQMLGAVQRMTWAYMRSQLYEGDGAWGEACKVFSGLEALGKIESKE